jgi:nucleotidyltransferase/DNA polymerase involved in DNA repair
MNFLEKNSIKIDPFSIDEAFCEISGIPEYYEVSTQKYLQKIQKDILDEIGVPVSI